MKITRLNLISFGKFKNKVIDLSDLCVIYGENGAGKSTIAAFIRIMLFGVRGGRGFSDRSRFTPWNADFIEGELTFTHNGGEYTVHRFIGASSKSDRCTLINQKTGEVLKEKCADILGADSSLLENTAYIAQGSTVFSDENGLSEALRSAIFGSGEDAEGALKLLDAKRRLITNPKSKNKGRLDIIGERMAELKAKREDVAKEKAQLPALYKYAEELNASFAHAQSTLTNLVGQNPQKELMLLDENLRLQREKIANLKGERERLEEDLKRCGEAARCPNVFLPSRILPPLAAVLAVLGVLLAAYGKIFFAATGFAAAVGCVFGFIRCHRICARLKSCAIYSAKDARRLKGQKENLEERLCLTDEKIKQAEKALDDGEIRHRTLNERAASIKNEIASAQLDLQSISRDLFEAREEIRAMEAASSKELDREIEKLENEAAALNIKLDIINAAQEGISKALKRLGDGWLPALAQSVAENFEELTGERVEILIDSHLNIKIHQNGAKDFQCFSAGTRDQLYLSLRLAAAKILFPSSPPPLLLDDPFVQYDKKREESSVDMLCALSKKYQIILFTCKNTAVFTNKKFRLLTI